MQYEITANVPGQWYILVKGNHNEPPVALFYDLDAAEAFIVSLGAGVQQQTMTDAARESLHRLRRKVAALPHRQIEIGHAVYKRVYLQENVLNCVDAEIERLDRSKGE